MKPLVELTETTQVTSWIPEDVYANLILDGVVCYGDLSGVVTAMAYNMAANTGDTIQVRYINKRSHSCTSSRSCLGGYDTGVGITTGDCLSMTSSTFGTYPVEVSRWGDGDLLCDFAMWAQSDSAVQMIINEMSKRMAYCRDAEIYAQIADYLHGTEINTYRQSDVSCSAGSINGSCCTYTYNLYNSIVTVAQEMRAGCYNPDTVILNPDVAAYFYFKDSAGYPLGVMPGLQFDANGKLITLNGLRVIETGVAHHCNNTDNVGTQQYPMAVIIDSSRAVAEVWGKHPTFETQRVPECDDTKLVVWQYWGAHSLDLDAIGWVVNPNKR